MDYLNIILEAIEQVEKDIFEENLIKSLYKKVYISKFHFHRMFYLVTKSTLGQYIKKRRFTEVCKRLRETDKTLLSIGLEAGYSSHEAFTRAFKSYFACTPSQYRQRPENYTFLMTQVYSHDMVDFTYYHIPSVEIVESDSMILYGVKGESSLEAPSIDKLWQEFRNQNKGPHNGPGYTVWLESDLKIKDLKDSVFYGCFVGSTSENDMECMKLAKATYAKFTLKKNFDKIPLLYAYIYFDWIKKSEFEFTNDMILEYYDRDFDYHLNQGSMSILIPVRKKQ